MKPAGSFPTTPAHPRPIAAALVPAMLVAACLLTAALAPTASLLFYSATFASAAVLVLSWWFFGDRRITGGRAIVPDILRGLVIGVALTALFAVGALIVRKIPVLAGPVNDLLGNAAGGAVALTLTVTFINGVAEELFFRDTVVRHWAALGRWAPVAALALYVAVTAAMLVPLLAVAAISVGAAAHWEVARTRALTSAIVLHVVWSSAMIAVLPALM